VYSLLGEKLKDRIRVPISPKPPDQFIVTHVGDLCADLVPNLAHALDTVEGFGRGFTRARLHGTILARFFPGSAGVLAGFFSPARPARTPALPGIPLVEV